MFISNFIKEYGNTMLYTVLMGVISYVGILIKKFLDDTYKYFVKKEIINVVCRAVEQLYGDCSGEEKLSNAINIAKEMFSEKGMVVGDLELRMMIECCVNEKGV